MPGNTCCSISAASVQLKGFREVLACDPHALRGKVVIQ